MDPIVYHQYTPFMLAYIPAPWIRHQYDTMSPGLVEFTAKICYERIEQAVYFLDYFRCIRLVNEFTTIAHII